MLIFLVIALIGASTAEDSCTAVTTRSLGDGGSFEISKEVSKDNEFDLHVETNFATNSKSAVLVQSEVMEGSSPVYFSVVLSSSMRSWQVPAPASNHTRVAKRVFTPLPGPQKLRVYVTTDSIQNKKFTLTVSTQEFYLSPDEVKKDVPVSLNAPSVFKFSFPPGNPADKFLIKITNSSLAICSTVSVQRAGEHHTTILDEESNIKYGSSYQTMLQKAAILVSREQYPHGFFLVLLAKTNNKACYRKHEPPSTDATPLSMNVTVVVESLPDSVMTDNLVVDSIILVFLFYLSLLLFFFILTSSLDRFCGFEFESKYGAVDIKMKEKRTKERKHEIDTALVSITSVAIQSSDQVDAVTNGPNQVESDPEKPPIRFRRPWWFWNQDEWQPRVQNTDDVDFGKVNEETSANNGVTEHDNESANNCNSIESVTNRPWYSLVKPGTLKAKITTPEKNCCTLDQNCTTLDERYRHKLRSQLFFWLIALAGIFYALPAFQLVFNNQNPFIQGGDLDICYYNFFCVFSFGKFADFGHIFSNVGYIMSGLYFILKVFIRKRKFKSIIRKESSRILSGKFLSTGIPEQVGIFYALGLALVLEGVLSGIYHICPTAANFQFDTTFMFLIAVLVFLKLYQFRHADTTLTAQLVFLVIGIALTLEVAGYFTSHLAFWIVFIVIYIFFMLVFILKLYLNENSFKKVFTSVLCSEQRRKIQFSNPIPCIIVIIINILMAIFFVISQKPGVSRYLLAILMVNMMVYEVYYVCRKLHLRLRRTDWQENEGIRVVTMIYLLMSVMFMMGACYFFIKELKTSAGTPAESRNLNEDCVLLIFDNHDMWHFLSAAGLYQHFMFLLTLEDYNIRYMKQRNCITVF